ncbi:hypothetical protein CWI36_0060p0010 [Hamiltosporidium magnivora]|uniref:Uncharacterized protein n=1 Tax=Hamiltosporidium magnivora TaxID=148818 RepID=A0A4Q9LLY6_9MICR|nr:hypothetical protein CWI36_0060p0010 [Hamiltosporidium magnivora]
MLSISLLITTYILTSSLTSVTFYIINEENRVKNLINTDLTIDMMFLDENIEYFDKNNEITIFKNNILRHESKFEITSYYIPNTLTLTYSHGMFLNSALLKSLFDSREKNIRVFINDVSYDNFLLFLKLLDNFDALINQINIKAFIDILTIITMLEIKKSKQRKEFIKDLLRSLLYGINIFDLNSKRDYYNYVYNHIKRSILRDLIVFFMEFIYFDEKITKSYIVITDCNEVCFKKNSCSLYENCMKKIQKNKIYLRLNDYNIKKLSKLMVSYNLKNIWIYLFKIIRLDLVYFVFDLEESFEIIFKLLFGVKFYTEKFYFHSFKNATIILLKIRYHLFLKNLNVLKFNFSFNLNELKQILSLYDNVKKITIKTHEINFGTLKFLISYCRNNSYKSIKLVSFFYISENTISNILKFFPKNLIFLSDLIKKENILKPFSSHYMPFIYNAFYYITQNKLNFLYNILFLEVLNAREIQIHLNNNYIPMILDDSIFNSLRYCKTLKKFCIKNIKLSNELLMYILESTTLLFVEIIDFEYAFNDEFFTKSSVLNFNLKFFGFTNSKSFIKSKFMIYLAKFRSVSNLKIYNTGMMLENLYPRFSKHNFKFVKKNISKKIFLKKLEIIAWTSLLYMKNCLFFLSEAYDLVELESISLNPCELTEIDYVLFCKMIKLKVVKIESFGKINNIDLKKLFSNSALFNTVIVMNISVREITSDDIRILSSFKNLMSLSISSEKIDFMTIKNIKRKYFLTTEFILKEPNRENRSNEINEHLDSEFMFSFP